MRKLGFTFLSFSLFFSLFFSLPVQASSLNKTSPQLDAMQISMEVTEVRFFRVGATIPSTISYNKSGWRGTLTIYAVIPEVGSTNLYRVIYTGMVTCTGNCIAPTIIESDT